MKLKELIKQLKEYDKDTEIKIWYVDKTDDTYVERKMIKQDIIISKYDGKTTIIFYPLILN
jgi:hypothetical protein